MSEVEIRHDGKFRLSEFPGNHILNHDVQLDLFFRRVIASPSKKHCRYLAEHSLNSVVSQHIYHSIDRRLFLRGLEKQYFSIPEIRVWPKTRILHEFEHLNAPPEKPAFCNPLSLQPIPPLGRNSSVYHADIFRHAPIRISLVISRIWPKLITLTWMK